MNQFGIRVGLEKKDAFEVLVSLVTAFLAALFPAVKASRTPVLSAIHYE